MDHYKKKENVVKQNGINIDEASRDIIDVRYHRARQSGMSKSQKTAPPTMEAFLREVIERSKKMKPPCDIVFAKEYESFKLENVKLRPANERVLPYAPTEKNEKQKKQDQITGTRQDTDVNRINSNK